MIRKIIHRLLSLPLSSADDRTHANAGIRAGAKVHRINPSYVHPKALEVVHVLKQAGYEAYIVGGAVRDLILGLQPKDFDVATNATPEEVKRLFRRAFIIGKRFRIVHVVFGRGREHDIIEVSTFRASLNAQDSKQVNGNEKTHQRELASVRHAVDGSGRVLRDNVWGSLQEDAARRDFTINALYYDPETQIVVDYHRGIEDAKKRVIRMIGDAALRYREDPVRILRAIRFAAKLAPLKFQFESKTSAPIAASVRLLHEVPQSRLFDEMLKLLQTGHAQSSIEQLKKMKLMGMSPLLDEVIQKADDPMMQVVYHDTDQRVAQGKSVSSSFLLACLLWQEVQLAQERRLQSRQARDIPATQLLYEAIDEVFDRKIGDISGRGRLAADMREIWVMQGRFDRRAHKSARTLVEQPRFRAGFDFLRLRSLVGEVDSELVQWWDTFAMTSEEERYQMIEAMRQEQRPSMGARRRRRRR